MDALSQDSGESPRTQVHIFLKCFVTVGIVLK